MTRAAPLLQPLEQLAQQEVGRHIAPLTRKPRGDLAKAAASLVAAWDAHVAIVTGFFIPIPYPGAPRPMALRVPRCLPSYYRTKESPPTLVTDSPCNDVVEATARTAEVPLRVVTDADSTGRLAHSLAEANVTHVIAVERSGPASDDQVYTMHGTPVTEHVAPLHCLFTTGDWVTIGIGEGVTNSVWGTYLVMLSLAR